VLKEQIKSPAEVSREPVANPLEMHLILPNPKQDLLPDSMLKFAQEHVQLHGLSSIPQLVDDNEK
jgi:hypothetical protein